MPTHRELQLDTKRRTGSGTAWAVLAALLVPFAGWVLGVVYLLRERVGKGLALILLGFVCFGGWAIMGSAALVVGTRDALNEARLHNITVRESKTRHHPLSIRIGGETVAEYSKRVKANSAKARACEHKALKSRPLRVGKLEACLERAGV